MSGPRLTFLYPHLFRSLRPREAGSAVNFVRNGPRAAQKAGMNTTGTRRQETYAQRYGTAAEPQPPPDIQPNAKDSSSNQNDKSLAGAIEKEVKTPAKVEEKNAEPAATKDKPDSEDKENPDQSRDDAIETATSDPTKRGPELDASELHPREGPDPSAQHAQNARTAKPLESFLKTGTASAETQEEHKTPHLQAPPYVHHFDTFTLVKDLERGGFTHDQSVTLMKAVRILLAINLDVAKEGLVSKSDVENETYLFRAACSELRTEILNARKSSSTKQTTALSHLQHSFDILSQRATQETLALQDDLKGMLNDRRMAVRMQTQVRDSEISELNYKISVALGSDSKSVVEGMRWVLTRRAALAIAGMAVLILGSLSFSRNLVHEREMQARKKAELQGLGSSSSLSASAGGGGGGGFTVPAREMGTQTEQEAMVNKGESVGYVSLG